MDADSRLNKITRGGSATGYVRVTGGLKKRKKTADFGGGGQRFPTESLAELSGCTNFFSR